MPTTDPQTAIDSRLSAVLADAAAAGARRGRSGYLDLLGPAPVRSTGISQRLMATRVLPVVYERWWRPFMGQLAKGVVGPSMSDEHRIAHELLELAGGETVLDVACGPGNFTREFAAAVGEGGLAVGFDASETMLAQAVADTKLANVAYVRGDATALPFGSGVFDAVCCFAALNLFDEPHAALDEMVRVLRPGGRIALFTSCRRGGPAVVNAALGRVAGMTIFGRDELTDTLQRHGFEAITQRVAGLTQFVGGVAPS